MPCHNYMANAGSDANILYAWGQMKAAGIPKSIAVTALAISANETGWVWGMPRGGDDLYFPTFECDDCRQIIGWEFAYNPDGGLSIRHRPQRDADFQWAVQNGILTPSGRPGPKLTDTRTKLAAAAKWFEYAVHSRDVGTLGNFSIGPTQMFLHPPASWGHWQSTFGSSWERLWAFYTATDAGYIAETIRKYFGPGPYPGSNPNDDKAAIAWLSARQTGTGMSGNGKSIAENYWFGAAGYKNMKANAQRVSALIDANPNA